MSLAFRKLALFGGSEEHNVVPPALRLSGTSHVHAGKPNIRPAPSVLVHDAVPRARRCPGAAFTDASFDAVSRRYVVQHLAEPERAVSELVRVLRPGGRLSILDVDWASLFIEWSHTRV